MKRAFQQYEKLVSNNDTLEAIDAFYAENIMQYENNGKPIEGKATLYKHEEINLTRVTDLKMTFQQVVISEEEGKVWGELAVSFFSKKNNQEISFTEAFFQQWEHGKIVLQKFYYASMG